MKDAADRRSLARTGNGGAAQRFFHHRDHLKSIKLITNASGAEVKRTTYAPFGRAATHAEKYQNVVVATNALSHESGDISTA